MRTIGDRIDFSQTPRPPVAQAVGTVASAADLRQMAGHRSRERSENAPTAGAVSFRALVPRVRMLRGGMPRGIYCRVSVELSGKAHFRKRSASAEKAHGRAKSKS